MLTRKHLILLVFASLILAVGAGPTWAQRGVWEGCTLRNMRARYTDQQIGGYLLHLSAGLVRDASRAMAKARTPEERRKLAIILSRASRIMENLSITMKEKRLSQMDIVRFHQEITQVRRKIRALIP